MGRPKINDYTVANMAEILNVGWAMMSNVIDVFELKPIEIRYGFIPIYSKESFEKLKWYFDNRKIIPQLAEEYNTSPYIIRRFLKDNNLYDKRLSYNGFALTDEQKENLIKWLNKPLTEKLIEGKIKNFGSLENYKKEMVANVQKTTEEKYRKLYGDDWKKEIYGKRSKESAYEKFGGEEEYKKKVSMKSKERWENMTDEEKQDMKERMLEGNERKHGNKWYNNNAQCRATKQERYGNEFYNNSEQATKTTIERYKTKNVSYKYFYDDIWFDSSWEVQYYEYLKRNNINFKYHPCRIKMENGRYYEPDFLLVDDNKLVEIKNSFYVDENGKLRDFADSKTKTHIYKQKCMEENNVLVIIDIEPYRQFTDWEMKQLRKSSKILLDKKKEERRKNKGKKTT